MHINIRICFSLSESLHSVSQLRGLSLGGHGCLFSTSLKIMMFFSVSFYFYLNLLHLVECGDVCDPEKSDRETEPHSCNYSLIIPSTIKVTWWVSQDRSGGREALKCGWGCKHGPAGIQGLETLAPEPGSAQSSFSLGKKAETLIVTPHYDGHTVIYKRIKSTQHAPSTTQCYLLFIYSVFSMKTILVETLLQLYRHGVWHLSVDLFSLLSCFCFCMHVCVFIYIQCKVTLHSGWQWKLRRSEQTCGHSGGRRGWDERGT